MKKPGEHRCGLCQQHGDGHGHCWCCGARTIDVFDLATGTPRNDGHPVPDGAIEAANHATCTNGCPISGDVGGHGHCNRDVCPTAKKKIAALKGA